MVCMLRRTTGLMLLLMCATCAHSSNTPNKPVGTPEKSARGTTVIIVPDPNAAPKSSSPWGQSMPDSANEAAVHAALATVQQGGSAALAKLQSVLIMGPALWDYLKRLDSSLVPHGTPSELHLPLPDGKVQILESRSFKEEELSALVSSLGFQKVMQVFATGSPRAATEEERKLFYAMIPFEIAGKPVTVVDVEDQKLITNLLEGKLMWLDLISSYGKSKAAEQPRQPTTPEKRAKIVATARRLEQESGKSVGLEAQVEEAIRILVEAPDISVAVCADVAVPIVQAKESLQGMGLWLLGSGAFAIEHPDNAEDMAAVNAAGLRSLLKAYASSRRRNEPAVKLLEDLAAREHKGELDAWMVEAVQSCIKKKK
jgi:hypothetical protein